MGNVATRMTQPLFTGNRKTVLPNHFVRDWIDIFNRFIVKQCHSYGAFTLAETETETTVFNGFGVSVRYEHDITILYRPFLSVLVSYSVNAPLLLFPKRIKTKLCFERFLFPHEAVK